MPALEEQNVKLHQPVVRKVQLNNVLWQGTALHTARLSTSLSCIQIQIVCSQEIVLPVSSD